MEEGPPSEARTQTGAVFLSYASQDAEAAQRVCGALRAGGIEVWFDQSELRGGDAWDRQIRHQIHDCRLFIALISTHTEVRDEGYFRREWKLAVDRTHDMLEKKAFLLPVVIDATPERGAAVPEKFHEVQWTRLPVGETPPEFVARVTRLLAPESTTIGAQQPVGPTVTPTAAHTLPADGSRRGKLAWPAITAVLLAAALAYIVIDKLWTAKRSAVSQLVTSAAPPTTPPSSAAAFAPPPHSIAVLPFVNMSGDKEQEYFSDGLTEEILNSLARISELQVSARTSAFSFKGKDVKIGTIARELNVGAILEGSVRRAGNTIRVTAQLNNAVTGFHLWSQTYDRDLSNVLQLQTDIANAVANALRVTLLGDVAARMEVGGTHNPAAFDAYLRGFKAWANASDANGYQEAITAYTEAINLDPNYALSFAGRASALLDYAEETPPGDSIVRAQSDARRAISLAPELAEGHLALAWFYTASLDIVHADQEMERAVALAPGSAGVLRSYAAFSAQLGRADAGIAAARHALVLDPLNAHSQMTLGKVWSISHRYDEAIKSYRAAMALDPGMRAAYTSLGFAYYALGYLESARQLCEAKQDFWQGQICLALVYHRLGRQADAQALVEKLRSRFGDAGAYGFTYLYAQWGDIPQALKWLQTAVRLRDNDLLAIKTDPLMDPLRQEPRFQAVMRELKFPD